jgi:hypothetical protein
MKAFATAALALLLVSALISECAAQTYSTSFTGVPGSITCTDTNISATPGLDFNWTLPSHPVVHEVEKVGTTTVLDTTFPLPSESGSLVFSGSSPMYASTPFPYTFTISLTPEVPGATTSSLSFVCASATGTDFTIFNGAPFSIVLAPIPTLGRDALFLLALVIAGMAVVAYRRFNLSSRRPH